ncbi:coiled-coil domain-containing protein 63 [Photinus pyralis]|uniref:coiled-coil domain-containing protein 63 n=1 Tax=Photinus pyralis TaxID=7054 RepID=UPI0012676CC2|nr:coiled-coil domain-containing protein 63 [Photinus pyralis]
MDRDKKPLTAQEKIEMDLMAEAELGKLQRQYRIMECDRKAFSEETNTKLAKQRKVIAALKKEQAELLTDLKAAASDSNKRKDRKMTAKVNRLLDEHENYTRLIAREKSRLQDVSREIRKLERRVDQVRGKDIPDRQFEDKVRGAQRAAQALENQLDYETKRFCAVLEDNRDLRERIEHLLKDRAHFNSVWETLVEDLNQGKKLMLDLIEQATLSYDQREEWCSKLHALRIRNRNDFMLHAEEMKELQRQLDHDSKLYEFLGIKGQKRIMRDLEEKEMKKVELQKEEVIKQQERYQKMLVEIRELVGEEDVSRLASQYFKQEEENFALFNYVNELNHEIEVILEETEKLRTNIEDQKEINDLKADQQQKTVQTLTEDLEAATMQTERARKEMEEAEADLESILKGIDGLFQLIECDYAPILQLLGEDAAINQDNVMLYLGVLEKKVGELTANMYLKEKSLFAKKRRAIQTKDEKHL